MADITERNRVILTMPPRPRREINGGAAYCCIESERQLRDLADRRIACSIQVFGPDAQHIGSYLTDVMREIYNEPEVRRVVPA